MKKVYALLIAILYFNIANAQWEQTNGPLGGQINCLAVSEPNFFAGSENGILLSTNNGENWVPVKKGLPNNLRVLSIALNETAVFAGTAGQGVFSSTNNGSDWVASTNGIPDNATVRSFAIRGTTIFAGTYNSGVFISTNNGQVLSKELFIHDAKNREIGDCNNRPDSSTCTIARREGEGASP